MMSDFAASTSFGSTRENMRVRRCVIFGFLTVTVVDWWDADGAAAGTALPFTERCAASSASRVIELASSCDTEERAIEGEVGLEKLIGEDVRFM